MHFTPAPPAEPFFAGSESDFHKTLARFNQERFTPANPGIVLFEPGNALRFHRMEAAFVEAMRQEASAYLAENPAEPETLAAWFQDLTEKSSDARLFAWLAEKANKEQMRWILQQELAVQAGRDDLLAMTQVHMPGRVKMEIARAYWDEMGRGQEKAVHGEMLERLARHFGIRADVSATIPEALALENLLNAMAAHRQYAFHAVGALAMAMLCAPAQGEVMLRGLKRLKVPSKARQYFDVLAVRDDSQGIDWLGGVIAPLALQNATRARSIAEGAVMRLLAGTRCFEAYRLKFAAAL